MLSTYHHHHHSHHLPDPEPSEFDHPQPSSPYATPTYYYSAPSLYHPAPHPSYSSSKRVKLEESDYSTYSTANTSQVPSPFDCPPLIYSTVMTVPSHAQTIQPHISLHRASEPASPATITTSSSNSTTPLSSPSRIGIFADHSPNDLNLYDDAYQLSGKQSIVGQSYTHAPNQSSITAQFGSAADSLWSPYNQQYTTVSRHQQQTIFRSNHSSISLPSPETNSPILHRQPSIQNISIPKLFRTASDAVQDELFNPGIAPGTSQSHIDGLTSPDRNSQLPTLFQQAQSQHVKKNCPVEAAFIRDHSPFRANSPFHPARQDSIQSPTRASAFLNVNCAFASARANREKELQIEAEADALRDHMQREFDEMEDSPKTISPKDAYVEYREPEGEGIQGSLFATNSQPEDIYSQSSDSSFGSVENSSSPGSMQPDVSTDYGVLVFQPGQHHFQPQHNDIPACGMRRDDESSSDTSSRLSDDSYEPIGSPLCRPSDTRANDAAYSCTVQGCLKRFPTPSKMSKHRREAHRPGTPMGGGRDAPMKSLLQGPSRCTRTNPSTGKPCNVVFSRPYDLTRHEDTIHNMSRQKVRCELCSDEKTFSRQDALTRHKKVKHGIDK
jgi:hypothetical protein